MASQTLSPLVELIDALERVIHTGTTDCLVMPGHDSTCECANHRAVREAFDNGQQVLDRVRGA